MVHIYPNNSISFSTLGERFLFKNMLSCLPMGWHVFYEPLINGKSPDFILFNANYGIFIIEVKDYSKKTILRMDHFHWDIQTTHGLTTVKSPYKQVLEYRNELNTLLTKKPQLRNAERRYKNRLKLPIIPLCVFPFINSHTSKKLSLTKFIPKNALLTEDDCINVDVFFKKITASRNELFTPLELTQSDESLIVQTIYPTYKKSKKNGELIDLERDNNSIEINPILFSNYIDEQSYVTDKIAHLLNTQSIKLSDITIIINKNRMDSANATKYLNSLITFLDAKNFSIKDIRNKDGVTITNYSNINELNIHELNKVFMVDINSVPTNILHEQVIPFFNNNSSKYHIVVTTNKRINRNNAFES